MKRRPVQWVDFISSSTYPTSGANTNLSLKVSAFDRYDSTPQGRRPNDLDYALLLLWKL